MQHLHQKRKKIGSEIIKWYQGGTKFSHVLIIKERMVYQASHGFVNCVTLDFFLEENNIINSYSIDDSLIDFEFVLKSLGIKYGFFQLIKIAIKFLFKIKFKSNGSKRFICSEFVGKALRLNWVDDYTDPKQINEYLTSLKSVHIP